ncbi:MAG: DUF4139 domain-containing protein [Flavobacteriales bacterium]|nr:DUF4139 domain-containing protein [Flavobacteriales bacterium]
MKKAIFILGLLSLTNLSWAQEEKEKKVSTEISSAIVYLDGAEIHRSKTVNLEKGRTRVVFTGLSPKFNSNNIQVSTTNNVQLLAIAHRIDYLTNVEEKPRVIKLKDSLDLITQANVSLANEKDAYTIEKDMMLQNKSIGGNNNGVSVAELKQAADLYRTRIMEINKAMAKIDRSVAENNKTISRIYNELNQANAKTNYSRGEITLLLEANANVTTDIELKYLVSNAGWTPSYDIRAEDINKPIKLEYKAFVYNNTDIDWNNINFRLSTADPTLTATQPKLSPWYLNYNSNYYGGVKKKTAYNPYQQKSQDNDKQGLFQLNELSNVEGWSGNAYFNGNENTVANIPESDFESISVSELSAEFEIKRAYTVPSDNKPYIVDVIEHELPTMYKHYAVPKLDKDAFLLARITNWQDLNLIEGTANIYFGGTFVGQSFIETRNVSDTLDISLGRDNKVLVTRTKLKDFSSVKYIGSNRKETHAYRMVIKNNRKVPITIEVLDQVPVSQDSDIEVVTEEKSNADKNDLTGELKWEFSVEPNENKTVDLTFTVKYPKNKPITIGKANYKSRKVRTKF